MSCTPYHSDRFSDLQNFFETPSTLTKTSSLILFHREDAKFAKLILCISLAFFAS